MAVCSHCGKEIAPGVAFCTNCGAPVPGAAPAPPPSPLLTTYNIGSQQSYGPTIAYAGLVDRAVAVIVDSIILFLLGLVLLIPLGLLAIFSGLFFYPIFFLLGLLGIVYFTYFEGTTGQTPGKRLAGIKVVDERSGQPVDMGRALIRNILRIIDELPFAYLLGAILILVDSRKRRLGDMAANTIVVRA